MSEMQAGAQVRGIRSSQAPEGESAPAKPRTRMDRSFFVRSIITGIFAAIALFFGLTDFLRAMNPKALLGISKTLYLMPSMIIPLISGNIALFVALTDPQISLKNLRNYWTSRIGVIAAALALILSVTSGFLTLAYPNGVLSDEPAYRIPLNDTALVEATIEKEAGECTSGWATLTTITYHGIEYVNTCQTNHSAIIVFENPADAELGLEGVQTAAFKHIYGLNDTESNEEARKAGFASLNGSRWSIVGPATTIANLQEAWGGNVVSLNDKVESMLK